jgi:RNA polymerase sigma factor (sigma-70 family)
MSVMEPIGPRAPLRNEGVASRSEEDFVSFYRAHWPRLVAALAWSLPKGEDSRDVAQEAFARAFERWSVVGSHPRPDAWLFLTAYRFASKIRRRRALRERHLDADVASDPGNVGAAAEVHEILARLSPRQRAAVILRHHYGLSTRETARVLRCKEGTVKSLLARGRDAVRETVAPEER